MRLAKIEAEIAIYNQTPEELLELFDGLIAPDGLSIANIKGKKILNECLDLKFTKIFELHDEEEEVVFFQNEAVLKYYPSNNKTFKVQDIIRIDGRGDHYIVPSSSCISLFNSVSLTTIEIKNAKNIGDVKLFLEQNYPEYIVLRKIT
ncbi:hypothetical protein [Lysinibacillus sp. BPa_S21]|uniref:hypothetical protein n=1 Tax=Lysinibacillus sp. BPa_S21 TaxID=2932478 RepID=UPI00201374E5|nr:hypothetical protein [Lysinibacillus sp. BPa_S21]MCL1696366.1 hypothetical protein [Lysinibacillus sp. BPa_S21]